MTLADAKPEEAPHVKPLLPAVLTSYDLLKSFAVIIMIIDHIGHYFFPELLWWRAVGRIGFPIWFFLVGYARGRDLPAKLLICAGLLCLGDFIFGRSIFPLNALVTIALIRVSIDPVMNWLLYDKMRLWQGSAILFFLSIPTMMISEYGTQALITAIFGYLVRHREEVNNEKLIIHYMIFALMTFVGMQYLLFSFTPLQMGFVVLGTFCVRGALYFFKMRTFPELTQKIPAFITWLLQFGGRRTLEIYVVHLLLFKALAVYFAIEGAQLLNWTWG